MSGHKDKDFDDVSSLVSQLHLGGVRYREFGKPRTSALPPVADELPVVTPAATPTTVAAPAMGMAPAVEPARPAPVAVAAEPPPRLRPTAPPSPIAFTFERLRRQAIATAVRAPFIALQLPERHAVAADRLRSSLHQRTLTTVFAELEGHARARAAA